jgi:ATP-dependent Clp protease ATP-binding subunit ClpA
MRQEFDRLLDAARAHAKRRGHGLVLPAHLGSALIELYPDRAETLELTEERVEAELLTVPTSAGRVEDGERVSELLRSAEDVDDLIRFVLIVINEEEEDDEEEGEEEEVAPAGRPTHRRGRRIGPFLDRTSPAAVFGRDAILDDVVATLARDEPTVPVVVGKPGAGRTALLRGLAARVASSTGPLDGWRVLRVRADRVLALGGGNRLGAALGELLDEEPDERFVVCLDDVEVMAGLGRSGIDGFVLMLIRSFAENERLRLVLTITDSYFPRLELHDPELTEELTRLPLEPLSGEMLQAVVTEAAARLSEIHAVEIPDDVVARASRAAAAEDVRVHPGLAVHRLDRACARARVRGSTAVTVDDVGDDQDVGSGLATSPDELFAALRKRVVGQDHALERVVARLGVTTRDVDLDPSRPNGVFLFAGPTGVGKTELARALAAELQGNSDGLIRIDMSEYVHDWSVSRLIGPQPGYVGYTEPEQWLTTRVRANPTAVVLLDEIEKAHPLVWNTFLQVFDVGRLTDGRGATADFSKTVVIMTSNIGAEAFSDRGRPGFFRNDGQNAREDDVIGAIRARMPAELVNRLDSIVVFEPLGLGPIEQIAGRMVDDAIERLRTRGYEIEVGSDVVSLAATDGYDPAFGARHLRRAVERLLLEPAVALEPGRYMATVDGDRVAFSSVAATT